MPEQSSVGEMPAKHAVGLSGGGIRPSVPTTMTPSADTVTLTRVESGGATAAELIIPRELGPVRLIREIGRGGMGIVYDAWQNSVDRRVALKVLPAGVAADARTVTRFVREAKTAAQLHHPSVVPVFGMGVEADTPYYAMLTGQSPRTFPRS